MEGDEDGEGNEDEGMDVEDGEEDEEELEDKGMNKEDEEDDDDPKVCIVASTRRG